MNHSRTSKNLVLLGAALITVVGLGMSPALAGDEPEVTVEGLVLVPDSKVAAAYVHPDADFSVFKRVMIDEAQVAFRRGWEQDQRRSVHRVTSRDIAQIKERAAELLREVFVEELEAGGYEVVSEPADDVLWLRPAIIDLDVTAPDNPRAGRSTTFVSSAGAATLHLELRDSVTGQLLGRALDRQGARDFGNFRHSNQVRNSAEATRIFRGWAQLLVQSLDRIHGRGGESKEP
jgi:hypothetical protein